MASSSDSSNFLIQRFGAIGIIGALILAVLGLQPATNEKMPTDTNAKIAAITPSSAPAQYKNPPLDTIRQSVPVEPTERIEKILIASVPDPLQTQFGVWYDQLLEVYTNAICDAGYRPDRHWIPWDTLKANLKPEPGMPDPLTLPGVLVFRNEQKQHNVAVVFIVGESPNVGVNTNQLRYAIDQSIHLQSARTSIAVRAVGPFFTGSQYSWLDTIAKTSIGEIRPPKFELITGSANSLVPIGKDWTNEVMNNPQIKDRVTQHSTILSNRVLSDAALKYLKAKFGESYRTNNDAKENDCAMLREGDTGFGRALDQGSNDTKLLEIHYPMHISQLSIQAMEEQARRDQKLGLATKPLSPSGPNVIDRFQSFGGGATASVAQRIIGDAMAVIRRERIRYVGVQATDPRDAVFLAGRIHTECPYSRVFVTDADLMFTLPENKYRMRGVVIATSYPLYPPNQVWTGSRHGRSRHFFPSQVVQGCYNAMAAFLDKKLMREYGYPQFLESDDRSTVPPVWLTTIGENGRFVVLDVQKADLKNHRDRYTPMVDRDPTSADESPGYSPPSLRALLIGAVIGVALMVYLLGGHLRLLATKDRFSRYLSSIPASYWGFFSAKDLNPHPVRVALLMHQTLLAAATGTMPLIMVTIIALRSSYPNYGVEEFILLACLICLCVGWLLSVIGQIIYIIDTVCAIRNSANNGYLFRILIHCIMLFGTATTISLLWPLFKFRQNTAEELLFLERSAGLIAGHSLVIPIAFLSLALMIHAWYAIRRDWLGTVFLGTLPFPK